MVKTLSGSASGTQATYFSSCLALAGVGRYAGPLGFKQLKAIVVKIFCLFRVLLTEALSRIIVERLQHKNKFGPTFSGCSLGML